MGGIEIEKILPVALSILLLVGCSSTTLESDKQESNQLKEGLTKPLESKHKEENKEDVNKDETNKDGLNKEEEKQDIDTNTDNNTNVLVAKRDLYIQKLSNLELELENKYKDIYAHGSNADMIQAEYEKYTSWDMLLNEIYREIKKYFPENTMNDLKNVQRNWIDERDNAAKAASDEFEGGTAAPLAYNSALAEETKQRCYELVDEYMK